MAPLMVCLNPELLEKVITKFEEKSYFRLQQTCRNVLEFILKNRHMCVHLQGDYHLRFSSDWCYIDLIKPDGAIRDIKDMDGLCGVRLNNVFYPQWQFTRNAAFAGAAGNTQRHRIRNKLRCVSTPSPFQIFDTSNSKGMKRVPR